MKRSNNRWFCITLPVILVSFMLTPAFGAADTVSISKTAAAPADTDIILDDGASPQEPPDTAIQITKMPEVIRFVNAQYPAHLQKSGIEGAVLMNLVVNDSGRVDSVAIVKSLNPELDTAAMKAAREFIFSPAMADTQKIAVMLQYEYRFTLNKVIEKTSRYVNFSGTLIEKGTKNPISDGMVVITFIDTVSDTSLPVPFSKYREQLGKIDGQFVEEDHLVTLSDSLGNFRFFSLPACSIVITVPIAGYKDYKQREKINISEATTVKYYLERVSYSDYEITVYGKVEEKEISKHELTLMEIKKIPGLGGDAVKVVQAMPGVARPTFMSGAIVVRGAPSGDSKYLIDGLDIPLLYHFGGLKSVYNSEALDAVDFYPGGFNVRYGGAIAGVIEIKSRQAKKDRWHGYVDLGTIDGSFLAEGPVGKKVSILASARRSFIGDILGYYFNHIATDYGVSTTPFYWDYILRADINPNPKHHIFITNFASRDTTAVFIKNVNGGSGEIDKATNAIKMSMSFVTGILGWDWNISDRLKNAFRFQLGYNVQHISVLGFVKVDRNYKTFQLRDELAWKLSEHLTFNPGVDALFWPLNMILAIPSGNGNIARDTSRNWLFGVVGAYLNCDWKIAGKLTITPGFRYDYFPELQHKGSIIPEYWKYTSYNNRQGISGEPSLRLTARYNFLKNHTIKGAVGNYSQTPQPIAQVIMKTWGDPSLPTTKASHLVLGYEWQITDVISADVQVYHNYQWNIPRMADEHDINVTTGSGKGWYDDGKGKMNGLEILLKHDNNSRFFGWISYSLSKSQRYNRITGKYELFGKDQTNNLQILGSWHLKREWDLGFRARYVTGNPTTPTDSVMEFENGNMFVKVPGVLNSTRMDPFFQLDLRVDKKIVYKKWIFSLYLDLQNISYFLYKSPEFILKDDFYKESYPVSSVFLPGIGFRADF